MSNPVAVTPGRVAFEGAVSSPLLAKERWIRIYLPGSYDSARRRRYPVLYVHDGQNAFTTVGDHVAYGWGNWQLDRTAGHLAATGHMREIVMVAIDCGAQRYLEYRGPLYGASSPSTGSSHRRRSAPVLDSPFDRYRRFLLEELKPLIDCEYRTLRGPRSTAVLGASMGGLCSLVLAWEHSAVFGAAASLSGSFQVQHRNFLSKALRLCHQRCQRSRVYLDSGVIDSDGGDDGRGDTEAVARELRRLGWRDGIDLVHHVDDRLLTEDELANAGLPRDKWNEARSNQHNEFYWRRRAGRALTFLFPPKRPRS